MQSDTSRQDAMENLGRLLVDPDFEQLGARLHTFNIFLALTIEHHEIRHSNVLGWLLDPNGTHGLGPVFLRRFLSSVLLDSGADSLELSAAKIELMEFPDIEVRREWRHIDLLVVDRRNRLVLLVENKVWAGESDGQLKRYRDIVQKEFPDFQHLFVFLTREGHDSGDEQERLEFSTWSHARVLGTLTQILSQRRKQLTESVVTFIEHYLDVLRRLTMQDQEMTELCKSIYRKHREAIDLIVELGKRNAFQEAAEEELKARGCDILCSTPVWVWFLPRNLAAVLPENCVEPSWARLSKRVSVCCWIVNDYGDKVRLVFECTTMKDPKQRLQFIQELRDRGFRLTKHAFKVDATYSRFHSYAVHVDDFSDVDLVRKSVGHCLDAAKDKFEALEAVCHDVFGGTSK